MATGFGGVGSLVTNPNGVGDRAIWRRLRRVVLAHSAADKGKAINENWSPYPWEPGTVFRYRDQDFNLLASPSTIS